MSPVPIIQRQQALTRIGEIRTGGEKPERGAGKKLEAFRLTSQHKDIIERCASLYGGEPKPWASPAGDAWQLYTTSAALPVLLVVDYSLKQVYELRDGQSCIRRCDGVHEDYSDGPCICNTNEKDECEIISRLMVVLPETGTGLGWQVRSKGENAARELPGAITIAENLSGGRPFVPATLRLTQRRNVINGQTVRYTVPVLDFDMVAEARRLTSDGNAIGPPLEMPRSELGHRPVAQLPAAGVTVEEGLALAQQDDRARGGRKAAPIPTVEDIPFGDEPVPVPQDDTPAPKLISEAQRKRLFAIAKTAGIDNPALKEFVVTYTGQDSTKGIPVDTYEPLCAAVEAQGVIA